VARPAAERRGLRLLSTYGRCGTSIVVYGHIHRPYVRRVGELVVANNGSVGSPFDGDSRASYMLVDGGRPEIVRVEYDVEREVSLMLGSGYPDAARLAQTRSLGTFVPVAAPG
jgi:predicted phosphodiesterase